ncbi:MAG: NADH:ubiquinone reductase (Na(+)-transporting) subunit B [Verrucomicrobia bacterium]|nr:NADH:ubiquinone reductase (Na(+)-transporting) subunit B [Verrucomicrobiota bacterium]
MLRKFLDHQLSLFEVGKPLHRLRPLVSAGDTFLYEAPHTTKRYPLIRDSVDAKRWMILVVISLIPCILMALWNTGIQKLVYASGDPSLMASFLSASTSWSGYWHFVAEHGRFLEILRLGAEAFLPIVFISYAVGGICEALFAVFRRHEIAEGFLVTGILYALILPPTIPYWMAALGVAFGVVVGKEFFGGTGMNILNPALTARVFLFFTFPGKMTGSVWVGTNPTTVASSLKQMNGSSQLPSWDSFTQATPLSNFNVGNEIKRVHVDAIAANAFGSNVSTSKVIEAQFAKWQAAGEHADAHLGQLTGDQLHDFVTAPLESGGLSLPHDSYDAAFHFSSLQEGAGINSNWNLFLGNRLGSMGETSILCAILGALFLIWTGVGAWRTMVAMGLGAYLTALLFNLFSTTGVDEGAWNVARFAFPAYKQLLMGSLVFGLVFMATEPVTSPYTRLGKYIYGAFCGFLTVIIRVINPAYPEGVMLAILFGNVMSPMIDHYSLRFQRRPRRVRAQASL